ASFSNGCTSGGLLTSTTVIDGRSSDGLIDPWLVPHLSSGSAITSTSTSVSYILWNGTQRQPISSAIFFACLSSGPLIVTSPWRSESACTMARATPPVPSTITLCFSSGRCPDCVLPSADSSDWTALRQMLL